MKQTKKAPLTLNQKQSAVFLELTVDNTRNLIERGLAGLKDMRPAGHSQNTHIMFDLDQLTRAAKMLDALGARSRNDAALKMVRDHDRAQADAAKPLIPPIVTRTVTSVEDRLTMIETVLSQQGKVLATLNDTMANMNRAVEYLMAPTQAATKSTAPVN